MIAKIYTQLPSGILACLHIRVQLPRSVAEHTETKFCLTQDEANRYMERMLAKWITNQVMQYCNQRMHALQVARMYAMHHQAAIRILENIVSQSGYLNKCSYVVRHQAEINQLMPGQDSPQYRWYYIFHHLIHHCYETTQAHHLHAKSNIHPVAEGVPQSAI